MSKTRNAPARPPARKPVPFTQRAPQPEPTQRTKQAPSRTRILSAQNAKPAARWTILAIAFGVPALALFAISMVLSTEHYRLNTELFTERLVRATILALSGGAAVAMFVAVFGRGSESLPLGVKLAAMIMATAALAIGLLFGLLL